MAAKRTTKKKRRSKSPSGVSAFITPVKGKLALIVLAVCLSALLVYAARYFFLENRFFTVKEVMVTKSDISGPSMHKEHFGPYFIGRNIFRIDLSQTEQLISKKHPELKKMEIRKRFPDTIEIYFVNREPLAVIEAGRGAVTDADGIVLDYGTHPSGVIKIKGVSMFFDAPAKGGRITDGTVSKALKLAGILKEKLRKPGIRIESINVSDRNDFQVSINGVTVKMGRDGFSRKILSLSGILNDKTLDIKNINYIDLRFAEPVIAPK